MTDNITRPNFDARLEQFAEALFGIPWIAERVLAGQQFNTYATDDEEALDEEDADFSLCIGPISDFRFICGIEGRSGAAIVEAALKVATEAFREKLAAKLAAGEAA